MPRPRRHKTNADRQKAYRDRKRAADEGVTRGQTDLVQRVMRADEEHRVSLHATTESRGAG